MEGVVKFTGQVWLHLVDPLMQVPLFSHTCMAFSLRFTVLLSLTFYTSRGRLFYRLHHRPQGYKASSELTGQQVEAMPTN